MEDLKILASVLPATDPRSALIASALECGDCAVQAAVLEHVRGTMPKFAKAHAAKRSALIASAAELPARLCVEIVARPLPPTGGRSTIAGMPDHTIEASLVYRLEADADVRIIAPIGDGSTGQAPLARSMGEWWAQHGASKLGGRSLDLYRDALLASPAFGVRV